MLRALECGVSIADLDYLELGDLYDILAEHMNDDVKYDRIATQEDMDKF